MQAKTSKILVVDDDPDIREIVHVLLASEGFSVIEASDGQEALDRFEEGIDLVILDVMMNGMSGHQVCLRIREKSNVPILFLTAKDKESDLTMGFSLGGDDYLAKPFSYTELVARVKGLIRRYQTYRGKENPMEEEVMEWNGIRLDCNNNEVWQSGKELSLTETEYQILRLLLRNHGKIFSAQNLYENVWEEPFYVASSNTVMVHIRRLREKIEINPQEPLILKTIWGKGYRIE